MTVCSAGNGPHGSVRGLSEVILLSQGNVAGSRNGSLIKFSWLGTFRGRPRPSQPLQTQASSEQKCARGRGGSRPPGVRWDRGRGLRVHPLPHTYPPRLREGQRGQTVLSPWRWHGTSGLSDRNQKGQPGPRHLSSRRGALAQTLPGWHPRVTRAEPVSELTFQGRGVQGPWGPLSD